MTPNSTNPNSTTSFATENRPLGALVRPLLDRAEGAGAVAVGAVRGGERVVLCRGAAGADSRFEGGSLTKTFTALLLAELAARGEVRYDDPLARHLPHGAPAGIALLHLATHTSGLPTLPPGLLRKALRDGWFGNPYAGYSADRVLTAVPGTRLRHPPGTRVRYSNFGAGLLGHALAHAAGTDYPALLAERVLRPLGLADTDCDPGRPQLTGTWHGRPRPAWLIPGLPAAGALRSSARDMLTLLQALLAPGDAPSGIPSSLRTALADVQRPRLALPRAGRQLCLIWNRSPRHGRPLVHHSGATRGFSSFAGFLPQTGAALVAFANVGPSPVSGFIQASYDTLRALER